MRYCVTVQQIVFLLLFTVFFVTGKNVFCQDKKTLPCDHSKKYAVETIHGVPMITVDGKPVRGRIFWGRTDSGNSDLFLTSQRQIIDFEYSPLLDANKVGTVHFRFEKKPGTVIIDDFSITEVRTGKKLTFFFGFNSGI